MAMCVETTAETTATNRIFNAHARHNIETSRSPYSLQYTPFSVRHTLTSTTYTKAAPKCARSLRSSILQYISEQQQHEIEVADYVVRRPCHAMCMHVLRSFLFTPRVVSHNISRSMCVLVSMRRTKERTITASNGETERSSFGLSQ